MQIRLVCSSEGAQDHLPAALSCDTSSLYNPTKTLMLGSSGLVNGNGQVSPCVPMSQSSKGGCERRRKRSRGGAENHREVTAVHAEKLTEKSISPDWIDANEQRMGKTVLAESDWAQLAKELEDRKVELAKSKQSWGSGQGNKPQQMVRFIKCSLFGACEAVEELLASFHISTVLHAKKGNLGLLWNGSLESSLGSVYSFSYRTWEQGSQSISTLDQAASAQEQLTSDGWLHRAAHWTRDVCFWLHGTFSSNQLIGDPHRMWIGSFQKWCWIPTSEGHSCVLGSFAQLYDDCHAFSIGTMICWNRYCAWQCGNCTTNIWKSPTIFWRQRE